MEATMDEGKSALLKDLWVAYETQMIAMKTSLESGMKLTSTLHGRMAEQLLETYFDVMERIVNESGQETP